MPIITSTSLVIGRGELYFGRFWPGTLESEGELYFGNTPGFSVTRTVEEVERFTSYGGQQIKGASEIIRENTVSSITTDNINIDNMALWLGGDVRGDQVAIGTVSETLRVKRGRHYQLGTSYEQFGVRHIEPSISFRTANGDPIPVTGNFDLRREEGRFYVLPDATNIADGQEIAISFEWRESRSRNTAPRPIELVGSLRFISQNPVGPRKNYFFPYVQLRSNGAIDLKGDQWQQLLLNAEIRKLSPAHNFFYVLETAPSGYTEDERAIIELGPLALEAFPASEDLLDRIINTLSLIHI